MQPVKIHASANGVRDQNVRTPHSGKSAALDVAGLLLGTADAARVRLVLEGEHRAHDRELAPAQRRHRRVAGVDVHLLGAALGACVELGVGPMFEPNKFGGVGNS